MLRVNVAGVFEHPVMDQTQVNLKNISITFCFSYFLLLLTISKHVYF